MKWLTLDYIKAHSRLDYNCEDSLLELYGGAAEDTVLNILNRTYDEVVEEFGTDDVPIPNPIIQASLMLVEVSYTHRIPVSPMRLSEIPYTFDMLVKPYMKLGY